MATVIEPSSRAATAQSEFHTVACPGMGCHQNCPLRAEVRDGRLVGLGAAPVPGSPDDTHACLRGLAAVELPYIPQRLKHPMRRVGARGEGRWERISWDEAYRDIAARLIEIRDTHGPQAVLMHGSGSSSVPLAGVNAGGATGRFANLFGCTEIVGWPVDGAPYVAGLAHYGFFFGGANDPRDWVNAKLIIIWGENMAESAMRDFNHVMRARAAGAKLIVISPLYDATAAKADWWIPIEPATDGALALALTHLLIDSGQYDADYVRRYTVAPFLVRADNGQFLRAGDIGASGSADAYVVWDEAAGTTGAPVAMPAHTSELPGVRPALHAAVKVAGIACRTAFDLLAERAGQYTPQRASALCKIPEAAIRKLAQEYAAARPSTIKIGIGATRTLHGDLNARAILALGSLTGDVGRSGGGASGWCRAYAPMLNPDPVYAADGRRSRRLHISQGHHTIVTGEPWPIKAMLVFATNPFGSLPNRRTWVEDILPKLDFVLAVDIVESDTAHHADLVLPGTTIFERTDLYTGLGCTILSEQAIAPQHEARSDLDIMSELARRVGLGEFFTQHTDDYLRAMLDHPTQGGLTLDRLREAGGMVRAPGADAPAISFADKRFPTPSGRMEFYVEYLHAIGEALPDHRPPRELGDPALAARYPLQFFTGRRKFVNQSQSYQRSTRELNPLPYLRLNPLDAQARGLADDDWVRVFNQRGEFRVRVQRSEGIRPGTAWIEHGWWPKDFPHGHYQDLLPPLNLPAPDMLSASFAVYWEMWKQYAETAASPGLAPYGLADQVFDVRVEVERAQEAAA